MPNVWKVFHFLQNRFQQYSQFTPNTRKKKPGSTWNQTSIRWVQLVLMNFHFEVICFTFASSSAGGFNDGVTLFIMRASGALGTRELSQRSHRKHLVCRNHFIIRSQDALFWMHWTDINIFDLITTWQIFARVNSKLPKLKWKTFCQHGRRLYRRCLLLTHDECAHISNESHCVNPNFLFIPLTLDCGFGNY